MRSRLGPPALSSPVLFKHHHVSLWYSSHHILQWFHSMASYLSMSLSCLSSDMRSCVWNMRKQETVWIGHMTPCFAWSSSTVDLRRAFCLRSKKRSCSSLSVLVLLPHRTHKGFSFQDFYFLLSVFLFFKFYCTEDMFCSWFTLPFPVLILIDGAGCSRWVLLYVSRYLRLSVSANVCPALLPGAVCVFTFFDFHVRSTFVSLTTLSQMLQSPWGWCC